MASSIRKVKSADRTLDIFEVLAESSVALSAAEIASALSIPKSSLFHLLGTLVDRAYLQETSGGRYSLGPKFAALARSVEAPKSLLTLISPILREFTGAINETSGFSVQRGDEVEVLRTHISNQALTYTMRNGDLAPLYAVSAGKALLAESGADWFDAYLERVRFEQFTPNTIRSPERLIREVERARADGVAYVDEEFTPGIVGMAAVVRSGGTAIGAINVAFPKVRSTPELVAKIRQKLFSSVRRAEAALAGNTTTPQTRSEDYADAGLHM